ncbi:MAG TPA: hypothetical protein VFB46_13030, partial [Gemmatimonadaceae bacterium]|nr:hypothetical protein [Gemmatimonadaceae bacterium]
DFPLEARGADAVEQLGRQNLDDDAPTKRPLDRHEHARHTAAGKLTLYGVNIANGFLKLAL